MRGAPGTTLCISHKMRMAVNSRMNEALALAQPDAVLVKAPEQPSTDYNQPQDMHVWPGIVLMARTKADNKTIKNGQRYQVVGLCNEEFKLAAIDDDGTLSDDVFPLSEAELARNMRLTHAITYFSSQARTIGGGLRLADTDSPRFTIRHSIVGLGRAPNGCDVNVE